MTADNFVEIPFKPRFEKPMLDGVKTMTSRTRRMAFIGDMFRAFGATFRVTAVYRMRFAEVLDHWREEGCVGHADLIGVWHSIHPHREFKADDLLWAHFFHMIARPTRRMTP